MTLIEWEVSEDSYQEQILIPEAQRKLANEAGIGTENKQRAAARIQNLTTGETCTALLAITGTRHLYLPVGIQKMLEGAGRIRYICCESSGRIFFYYQFVE